MTERKQLPSEGERLQLLHSHAKNIATLSAGSIVVVVTLGGSAALAASAKAPTALALVSLVAAILLALLVQAVLLASYPIGDWDKEIGDNSHRGAPSWIDRLMFWCWAAFALGMICLAISGYLAFQA